MYYLVISPFEHQGFDNFTDAKKFALTIAFNEPFITEYDGFTRYARPKPTGNEWRIWWDYENDCLLEMNTWK